MGRTRNVQGGLGGGTFWCMLGDFNEIRALQERRGIGE